MMKLVVEPESRRVLGVHIVGHGAAEMIQLAAVAVRMGATKDDFEATMAVHPTSAEELVTMRHRRMACGVTRRRDAGRDILNSPCEGDTCPRAAASARRER